MSTSGEAREQLKVNKNAKKAEIIIQLKNLLVAGKGSEHEVRRSVPLLFNSIVVI